ncbi:MAG: acyl-CoA dehydrogenase family protein [Alphaproteobacteria bacterium]
MPSLLTSEDILSNVRTLAPEISARAGETAKLRQIPRDLVEKLRVAGVFRVMFPKSWGGPEMPLPQQVELFDILGYADPSVAWATKINTDSGYFAAFLDEDAARELYPDIDMATAGQAPPNGRAVKAPGGYRVTGRWGFGSGITHADVIVAGCMVVEEEGAAAPTRMFSSMPGMIFVLAPAKSWTIEDTWYSNGLAGTGSHHYHTKDLFVPERHTFTMAGAAKQPGPLYADGGSARVFVPMAGLPLGLMRRVIEEACKLSEERKITLPAPPTLMKEIPRIRFAIARAQMLHGAARAYVYDTVGQLWDELVSRGQASLTTRREVGIARIHAHRTAREVAQLMFDTVGAPAVYQNLPFGSLLADSVMINQHLGFNDGVIERLGGMMLGGSPDGAFV